MYEILLSAKEGVSKTRAVYLTNLNFHLMEEYWSFLLEKEYLQRVPNGSGSNVFKLTGKGGHLLDLLVQLEEEVKAFREPNRRGPC